MKLPIGISDFKELREGEYDLIDKSLLIKDIIDDGAKIILITRPRRFGKTLNMSMLYYYFVLNAGENQKYFRDLQIWQQGEKYKENFGKYPAIFISLREIKNTDYESAFKKSVRLSANCINNFVLLYTILCLKKRSKKSIRVYFLCPPISFRSRNH